MPDETNTLAGAAAALDELPDPRQTPAPDQYLVRLYEEQQAQKRHAAAVKAAATRAKREKAKSSKKEDK